MRRLAYELYNVQAAQANDPGSIRQFRARLIISTFIGVRA